jgi:hypothetical protein
MLRLNLTRTTDGTPLCYHTVKSMQEADRLAIAYDAMPNVTVTVEVHIKL